MKIFLHNINIRKGINVAEFLAADEAGEDDVSRDAELGGHVDEVVSLLAVAREDENELGIFLDGKLSGAHEIGQAFLDGEAAHGRNDGVAGAF